MNVYDMQGFTFWGNVMELSSTLFFTRVPSLSNLLSRYERVPVRLPPLFFFYKNVQVDGITEMKE